MENPVIGIIMGSDSDLSIMKKAAETLEEFGVPYEMTIISAHRTPDKMIEYTRSAKSRGLKVLITGAGWAAALPGMVAALTPLPVIGVPLSSKYFGGMDALYSIVMTPPGVPVATVAVDGAKNSALLAMKMLAITDADLSKKLEDYAEDMKNSVEAKGEKLEKLQYKAYMEQM
ncbi:Phosphoribosylaminoimidazole carboxylase catalytic subunit [Lachnospiraceae bacterium TWA4]|nr:Phosphoribosylaminoimidazole carboxylase catalytic subunit [Lachnospiraceae bacterium TWA4]